MPACPICQTEDPKPDLRPCISCNRSICRRCQGDETNSYWTHTGKKGYACTDCIRASLAYEGGPLAVGRELKAHLHAVLLPEVLAAVDARLAKIRDETIPPIVDGALTRVEKLTATTLKQAEDTTGRLVSRLETAIGSQRVEVKTDVADIVKAINRSLRMTLIWVGVIVGLVNMAGIVAAVLIAKSLDH